jgi:hypothetical protein
MAATGRRVVPNDRQDREAQRQPAPATVGLTSMNRGSAPPYRMLPRPRHPDLGPFAARLSLISARARGEIAGNNGFIRRNHVLPSDEPHFLVVTADERGTTAGEESIDKLWRGSEWGRPARCLALP